MGQRIAGLLVTVVLALSTANAEVLEIPLPGLLGVYPLDEQNATRTVEFELPQAPLVVNGAWFRISGTTGVGTTTCDGGGLYPWPMDVSAFMADTVSAHVWIAWALMPEEPGPFAWTAEFRPIPSTATWEFLLDGEAEISLFGAPTALVGLCWPVSAPPTANVEEAVLIVDAEFPVGLEATSWGRIKALYEAP
jgi:hypothetical protein